LVGSVFAFSASGHKIQSDDIDAAQQLMIAVADGSNDARQCWPAGRSVGAVWLSECRWLRTLPNRRVDILTATTTNRIGVHRTCLQVISFCRCMIYSRTLLFMSQGYISSQKLLNMIRHGHAMVNRSAYAIASWR